MGYSTSSLTIMNSYFSGSGGVSSFSPYNSRSGGLVGGYDRSSTIMNSYFSGSGRVSSSSRSNVGGLVGSSSKSLTITNSYWNTDAPQSVNDVERMLLSDKRAQGNAETNPSGATGLTLIGLKATSGTYPDGLPSGATDETKAWDLGTDMQLPAVKLCVPTIDTSAMPPTIDWTTCASYGALLPGQR